MTYLKKPLDEKALDDVRINLAMMPKKLSAEPCCDFCGSLTPVFAYAATRMSNGAEQEYWRWLACATCSKIIDLDELDVLKIRIAKRIRGMLAHMNVPDKVIMASTEIAFEEFEQYAVMV